jgi:hypothetical protein
VKEVDIMSESRNLGVISVNARGFSITRSASILTVIWDWEFPGKRGDHEMRPKEIVLNDKMISLLNQFTLNLGPEKCWPWLGPISQGYGRITIHHVFYPAHRVSYLYYYGYLPVDLDVLHDCESRSCCNPKHLYLGNDLDHAANTIRKGRRPKGEQHYRTKILEEDFDKIRILMSIGVPRKEVAEEFNISKAYVTRINQYHVERAK